MDQSAVQQDQSLHSPNEEPTTSDLPPDKLKDDKVLRQSAQPFELQTQDLPNECLIVPNEEENRSFSSPQQELLYWHHR